MQEVLAKSSQEVRARFTFDQIPVLVEHGVLQVAIDGFDELVDADGYRDAWFALRDFLKELGGSGACVLAGRDTFFDEQGFLKRLEASALNIDLLNAHLQPASPSAARAWLVQEGWTDGALNDSGVSELLRPGSYALRPYFLKELVQLLGVEQLVEAPRISLIHGILRREAKLLAASIGIDEQAAANGLRNLYREIAADMADRETDRVEVELLGFVCEFAFDGFVSNDDLAKLRHRIGSIALLELDRDEKFRRFPHSEVQNHYLSMALIGAVAVGQVPTFLRRGVVSADFIEMFIDVLEQEREPIARKFVAELYRLLVSEISSDRFLPNGWSLILATLGREDIWEQGKTLEDPIANEVVLRDTTVPVILHRATFDRFDVRGADLRDVTFDDCHVGILLGDDLSKFGTSRPAVREIQIESEGARRTSHIPAVINSWFEARMLRIAGQDDGKDIAEAPLVRLLDRVCRRAMRQFYFRAIENDQAAKLLEDPLWPELEAILDREGRIARSISAMSGARSHLIHIKSPAALLNPSASDPSAERIRAQVISRARELRSANR